MPIKYIKIETTNKEYHCDFCEEGPIHAHSRCICIGCDKIVCLKCSHTLFYDPWTESNNGDYPEYLCPNCKKYLDKYEANLKKIHFMYDKTITGLKERWEEDCREHQSGS